MPTEYEQNQQLDELVAAVLEEQEFGPLRDHGVKIASCLKIKMDDNDEYVPSTGDPVQLKKVGPPFLAFIDYNYVLVFDAFAWNNHSHRRAASIHKALMRIKLRVTDSGVIKLGTRAPEIQEFTATLRRYGAYNEELAALMRAAEDLNRVI